MSNIEIELCNEFLKEIEELKNNKTLLIQILCLIQLIGKGIYLPVKLKTTNESVLNGLIKDFSYTSFILCSEEGIHAVVRYKEICDLDLKIGAA